MHLACIACGQGVQRLQQGLVWLIACSKRMVAGDQNLPRMAMSRTHLNNGCLLQSVWEYNHSWASPFFVALSGAIIKLACTGDAAPIVM